MKMGGPAFEKQVGDLRRCGLSDCEIAKKPGVHFSKVARAQEGLSKRIVSVPLVKNMWMMSGASTKERA